MLTSQDLQHAASSPPAAARPPGLAAAGDTITRQHAPSRSSARLIRNPMFEGSPALVVTAHVWMKVQGRGILSSGILFGCVVTDLRSGGLTRGEPPLLIVSEQKVNKHLQTSRKLFFFSRFFLVLLYTGSSAS